MSKKVIPEAQNPLILRASRLIEAFAKADDERDFYLDRYEGFVLFADLDKPEESLEVLEKELADNSDRYCVIPKMSFYETKKIMEGFVNEKVYDIDTKEKLLDIIQSKEAREHFLEFLYDQHMELDKWQQYYQERSRIRIIEWLRTNNFHFVFEEDLDIGPQLIEKLKEQLFETKIAKEILAARKTLISKAKTYYSTEALNPRPKRGRPPKQQAKMEVEMQISTDIYTTVPNSIRSFLFIPDTQGVSGATFSSKYENEEDLLKGYGMAQHHLDKKNDELGDINRKLASLRDLSSKWVKSIETERQPTPASKPIDSMPKNIATKERASHQTAAAKPVPINNKAPKPPVTPLKKSIVAKGPTKPAPSLQKKVPTKKVEPQKKNPPMRSIINKPATPAKPVTKVSKAVAATNATGKKRIIAKESEKNNGKRHLRKIIPKQKTGK